MQIHSHGTEFHYDFNAFHIKIAKQRNSLT